MSKRPAIIAAALAALAALIVGGVAYATSTGLTGTDQERFLPYTRDLRISTSAATLGPTAPTSNIVDTTGDGLIRALGFDAVLETVNITQEVPMDWDAASDMSLKVYWLPDDGDAVANGETVKFDITYRAVAEGEVGDIGTAATATITYSQTGAGDDMEAYETVITIPYTGGNQPLADGDQIFILFNRDTATDTYSGATNVTQWELSYQSNGLPSHT